MHFSAASVAVSSWTLVAISCERYYAICHPLRSRSWQTISHAYKIIGVIWLGGIFCMSPIAFFSQLIPTSRPGEFVILPPPRCPLASAMPLQDTASVARHGPTRDTSASTTSCWTSCYSSCPSSSSASPTSLLRALSTSAWPRTVAGCCSNRPPEPPHPQDPGQELALAEARQLLAQAAAATASWS